MQFLELTLETPEENLALDEALLDEAELTAGKGSEVLRIWEPRQMFVVAGNSTRLADEVQLEVCRSRGVPILRRTSGGATIVAGPGCLMYAVVLSYAKRPELRSIDRAHRFVLDAIAGELRQFAPVECAGISDLTLDGRKFSGNSLRCKRNFLLYHGTLLYGFPLEKVETLLKLPHRQPTYRQGRGHRDFLTNIPISNDKLRKALITAFGADSKRVDWPERLAAERIEDRYARRDWNERL
jgi:lipoate---protein ligase